MEVSYVVLATVWRCTAVIHKSVMLSAVVHHWSHVFFPSNTWFGVIYSLHCFHSCPEWSTAGVMLHSIVLHIWSHDSCWVHALCGANQSVCSVCSSNYVNDRFLFLPSHKLFRWKTGMEKIPELGYQRRYSSLWMVITCGVFLAIGREYANTPEDDEQLKHIRCGVCGAIEHLGIQLMLATSCT